MPILKNQHRSRIIKIRVNVDEMAAIKIRAGSSATAEWLRSLAMGFPIDAPKRPSRYRARIENKHPKRSVLNREVAKIGNNLNQLARAVNITKYQDSSIDLVFVATQLNLIWQELHHVQQNI